QRWIVPSAYCWMRRTESTTSTKSAARRRRAMRSGATVVRCGGMTIKYSAPNFSGQILVDRVVVSAIVRQGCRRSRQQRAARDFLVDGKVSDIGNVPSGERPQSLLENRKGKNHDTIVSSARFSFRLRWRGRRARRECAGAIHNACRTADSTDRACGEHAGDA